MHIPALQEKNQNWECWEAEEGVCCFFFFLISEIKLQLLQYAPSEILLLSVIFSTRREIK